MSHARERVETTYQRRAGVLHKRYGPNSPLVDFYLRHQLAALDALVRESGLNVHPSWKSLELGTAGGFTLRRWIDIGLDPARAIGLDIRHKALQNARNVLPESSLLQADAAHLPLDDDSLDLVLQYDCFCQAGDAVHQRAMAREVERILRPGGYFVWLDIAFPTPWRNDFCPISLGRLSSFFPNWRMYYRRVVLLPPVTRLLVPRAIWLADWLHRLPFMRSHLAAILVKP